MNSPPSCTHPCTSHLGPIASAAAAPVRVSADNVPNAPTRRASAGVGTAYAQTARYKGGTATGLGWRRGVGCTAVFTVEALTHMTSGGASAATWSSRGDGRQRRDRRGVRARQHRQHLHLHLRAKVCRSEAEAARHNEWHPGARLAVPPGLTAGPVAARACTASGAELSTPSPARRPPSSCRRATALATRSGIGLVHPLRARQRAQPSGVQGGVPDVRAGVREQ